ncbi:MAG: D-alanine--D-alanine ligase family protein [Planctomycetota bacterium]
MDDRVRVIVLGGGPDAERDVSLESARNVAEAVRQSGRFLVSEHTIGRATPEQLGALDGDVFFPVLHGPWGEGGPLQGLLERDGRPFVGCGAASARLAMDKEATKAVALSLGISTPDAVRLDPFESTCPLPLPVVVKPNAEGSTIAMHVCRTKREWLAAHRVTSDRGVPALVERRISGREMTVGVVGGRALGLIEIVAASGWYEFEGKYTRDDTRYILDPEMDPSASEMMRRESVRLCGHIGCQGLARVDWMLSGRGVPMLLEVNTMPGFTSHSLLPMASAHGGVDLSSLCERLVDDALGTSACVATMRREAVSS